MIKANSIVARGAGVMLENKDNAVCAALRAHSPVIMRTEVTYIALCIAC